MLFKMSPSEVFYLPVYIERFPEKIDSTICFYCYSIFRVVCRKRSLFIPEYDTQSDRGGRWNRTDGPMVTSTGFPANPGNFGSWESYALFFPLKSFPFS